MLRGIGIATSQIVAQSQRLKALGANLANADTPGYVQDRVSQQSFEGLYLDRIDGGQSPVGPIDLGPVLTRPEVDLSAGPTEPTGRPLDVAISGTGFFAVQAPDGVRYTRRGAFHQDAQGRLVSSEGWPVQGEKGPVAAKGPLEIADTGDVISNGAVVGRLKVVAFAAGAALDRRDGTYVVPTGKAPTPVQSPQLVSGYLEGSNVDLTTTMTDVIAATRSYQLAQRALVTEDTASQRLIEDVNGR